MDLDTLRPILSGLVGAAVVIALAAWVRRLPPVVRDGALVLRLPRALGAFGLVMAGIFGAFAVRNAIHGSAASPYLVALAVPTVLALAGLWIAVEVFLTSVVVSSTGVRRTSPWGTRDAAWSDVTDVSYSAARRALVLHTRAGDRIHVSASLVGVDAFLAQLKERGFIVQADDRAASSSSP